MLLIGVVSLFADMSYEGTRSITGPLLAFLGASAFITGFVAGVGELVGYALRIVFGYLSDRIARYWPITLWGYGLTTFVAVPLWDKTRGLPWARCTRRSRSWKR